MMHEDIVLAAQVIASSLCRLWRAPPISYNLLSELSESIADGAYTKLDKELDDGIDRKHFILWASERFKESKNLASLDSLTSLYEGDALDGLKKKKTNLDDDDDDDDENNIQNDEEENDEENDNGDIEED